MVDHSDTVFTAQRLRRKQFRPSSAASTQSPFLEGRPAPMRRSDNLVLIIDDSTAMIERLSNVLHFLKVDVIAALNGEEGLVIYEDHREEVSLIILDMNMPVMSGEVTLRRLRELDGNVPIIVSSSITEEEARRRCLEEGQEIDCFLPKPYELEQTGDLVRAILDR